MKPPDFLQALSQTGSPPFYRRRRGVRFKTVYPTEALVRSGGRAWGRASARLLFSVSSSPSPLLRLLFCVSTTTSAAFIFAAQRPQYARAVPKLLVSIYAEDRGYGV